MHDYQSPVLFQESETGFIKVIFILVTNKNKLF